MPYIKDYTKIKKETVAVVKCLLIKKRYYKMTERYKKVALKALINTFNNTYNTEVRLSFDRGGDLSGYGCYNPLEKKIYLPRLSVVTLLHEFKHALQHARGLANNEELARGWSLSLFNLASPKHYERAKRKRLLLFN